MFCPNCGTVLQMTERQGIEIDYCPSCRGIWLDRGELDKIIERARGEEPYSDHRSTLYTPHTADKRKRGKPADYYDADQGDDDRDWRRYRQQKPQQRRRKSWKKRGKDVLEDIFDIFD